MYFQHYPHAPVWGTMHWGHMTSNDLLHWKEHEIALFPTEPYDADCCFSGSSIVIDNRLYAYYTGVRYVKPDPDSPHKLLNDELISEQVCITSLDGYTFDNKSGKLKILDRIEDIRLGSYNRTRDPRV